MSRPLSNWPCWPFDADLADESARLINPMHDAPSHLHPSLERLLASTFTALVSFGLLAAAGTPNAIEQLGEAGIAVIMADGSPEVGAHPASPNRALRNQPW
jgi:hypothetical protein